MSELVQNPAGAKLRSDEIASSYEEPPGKLKKEES
jgi:hypothetical protein